MEVATKQYVYGQSSNAPPVLLPERGHVGLKAEHIKNSMGSFSSCSPSILLRIMFQLDQNDRASLCQLNHTFKKIAHHEKVLRLFFRPKAYGVESSIIIKKSSSTIEKIWAVPGRDREFMFSSMPNPQCAVFFYNLETQSCQQLAAELGEMVCVDTSTSLLLLQREEKNQSALFNYQTGKIVGQLPVKEIRAFAAYVRGEALFVACSTRQGLIIWKISNGNCLQIAEFNKYNASALCVTEYKDRPCFAVCTADNKVHLIDAENTQELLTLRQKSKALPAIHLKESSFFGTRQLALVRKGGSIERWHLDTARCEAKIAAKDQPLCVLDFACIKICNTEIWLSVEPYAVKLWDPNTLQLLTMISLYAVHSNTRSGVILRSAMAAPEEPVLFIALDNAVYRWDLTHIKLPTKN